MKDSSSCELSAALVHVTGSELVTALLPSALPVLVMKGSMKEPESIYPAGWFCM